MMLYLETAGALIGGLGIFMLAVRMITDGLKLAAGGALRQILGTWTKTPMHGIVSGVAITAIVQSSSAVTVATIGFVNAGLLSMYHALGVVFGANIGTTMTGWLVAIVGFKIKIEAFALPMIGFGMLLRLTRGGSRIGFLGEAVAGFGLFFIGIDILKTAFEGMATGLDLQQYQVGGMYGILIYVSIGFLMTMLTQSSSAAIAIILTAATGGILTLHIAAAMVIGANVGTTTTALLAAIGSTPNAKRVAAAHVVFNLMTGVVALMILPLLFWMIRTTGQVLGLEDVPAISLAMFHTTFNILGVVIMLPITNRLSIFLSRRFLTREEIEGAPKYLDKTVAVAPELALNALGLELGHIGDIARRMAKGALSTESIPDKEMRVDYAAVNKLSIAIADFMTSMEKVTLPHNVAEQLPDVLHTLQYYTTTATLAMNYANNQVSKAEIEQLNLADTMVHFMVEAVNVIDKTNPQAENYDHEACEQAQKELHESYRKLRDKFLEAGAGLRISIEDMGNHLEQINRLDRMINRLVKGAYELYKIMAATNYPVSAEDRGQMASEKQDETVAA
jgi:phosphate:Na+ symporter